MEKFVMKKECDILKWHLKAILYANISRDYSISSNEEDIFTNSEEKKIILKTR
jgi:hypothetical protein